MTVQCDNGGETRNETRNLESKNRSDREAFLAEWAIVTDDIQYCTLLAHGHTHDKYERPSGAEGTQQT